MLSFLFHGAVQGWKANSLRRNFSPFVSCDTIVESSNALNGKIESAWKKEKLSLRSSLTFVESGTAEFNNQQTALPFMFAHPSVTLWVQLYRAIIWSCLSFGFHFVLLLLVLHLIHSSAGWIFLFRLLIAIFPPPHFCVWLLLGRVYLKFTFRFGLVIERSWFLCAFWKQIQSELHHHPRHLESVAPVVWSFIISVRE